MKKPPKRPASPKKNASARHEVARLEDIPNNGPAVAADLRQLRVAQPADLPGRPPSHMYDDLCRITGQQHDPCLLDTFIRRRPVHGRRAKEAVAEIHGGTEEVAGGTSSNEKRRGMTPDHRSASFSNPLHRSAQRLEFLSTLVADRKVLFDGHQSFRHRFSDEMEFGELADLPQANVAVDLDRLGCTHHVEHLLDFFRCE